MTTTSTTAVLRIAVPLLVVLGVGAAVVLGRERETRSVTIPAGTVLLAALDEGISTDRSRVGDAISLHTVSSIHAGQDATISAGLVIHGTVTEAKRGGRVAGAPVLGFQFDVLRVNGRSYFIMAEPFRVRGRSNATESALEIGGGAAAGGILGRVFGGRGGTVKGAVAGAAIGTGVAIATTGDQLALPAGQRIRIRLRRAATLEYTP